MNKKLYFILLWTQGIYTLLTALWGLLDINSFMDVTGPKTDIWLVKTVSVLLVAIAISLLSGLIDDSFKLPVAILGLSNSIAMAFIDFYYTLNNTISKVYALDGIIEVLFITGWIFCIYKNINHRVDL
jgi:hypothetical protein